MKSPTLPVLRLRARTVRWRRDGRMETGRVGNSIEAAAMSVSTTQGFEPATIEYRKFLGPNPSWSSRCANGDRSRQGGSKSLFEPSPRPTKKARARITTGFRGNCSANFSAEQTWWWRKLDSNQQPSNAWQTREKVLVGRRDAKTETPRRSPPKNSVPPFSTTKQVGNRPRHVGLSGDSSANFSIRATRWWAVLDSNQRPTD